MRLRNPFSFDVRKVHRLGHRRRDRRIDRDHEWVAAQLGSVDASGRPNLESEIAVLEDPENFRANWVAIATHLRHVPDLSTSRGLELGCSVGTKLLIMQRLGAVEIAGCDSAAHLIDDGNHWIDSINTDNLSLAVSDERALPYESASFDWVTLQMVYCQLNEAAVVPLMSEMRRVLRSGGLALVHDGANPRHQPTATAMRDYYREVEIGPGTLDWPQGPLHVMRQGHIAATFPELESATRELLARNTAYMRAEEVDAAVSHYVDSGDLPQSRFEPDARGLRAPVVLDGQAVRRPTDPFEMRDELIRTGFEVEFQHSFLGGSVEDPEQHYKSDPSVFLVARKV